MNKKESTPAREACRRYEAKNKEKRKANNATFFTFVTRQEAEEMAEFLKKHKITKVAVGRRGYEVLKAEYADKEE